MWNLSRSIVKRCRRRCKMSGVSRDAPLGVQCIQRISSAVCPRLRINRLRWYQGSVLLLTYLTYMTYHLTRKPISVVKGVLHQNCSALSPPPDVVPGDDEWCNWPPFNTTEANALLGALDSAFLFSYAAAMFVSGMVAERVDLRYFLSFGMLISAIFCYLFGLAKTYNIHHISYYLFVQAGAGIAQTSGWPGTVATMGKWFGEGNKGLIFGVWNSHTSLGNILGTLMASKFVDSDWSLSFIYPALVMGAVAALVWLCLVTEPAHVGLGQSGRVSRVSSSSEHSDIEDEAVVVTDQTASLRSNRHSTNTVQRETGTERSALLPRASETAGAVSLGTALYIPGVVQYSLSLFFAKLVSYTFLYWLPLYIKSSTSLSARESGELSTTFDMGGAVGAILAGWLSDKGGSPALVCVSFYLLCVPALVSYQLWGATSYIINVVLLTITGVLVNGPYALITTAVSAELGTHSSLSHNSRALATVTAIIDGTGSVGAAVGPAVAGLVVSHSQWTNVFLMLVVCDLAAMLLLLPLACSEGRRVIQNRRLSSPPRVRIE